MFPTSPFKGFSGHAYVGQVVDCVRISDFCKMLRNTDMLSAFAIFWPMFLCVRRLVLYNAFLTNAGYFAFRLPTVPFLRLLIPFYFPYFAHIVGPFVSVCPLFPFLCWSAPLFANCCSCIVRGIVSAPMRNCCSSVILRTWCFAFSSFVASVLHVLAILHALSCS